MFSFVILETREGIEPLKTVLQTILVPDKTRVIYLVGILGIEPSVGFPDGFTIRSRTLRGDAQTLVVLVGIEPTTRRI